MLRWIAHSFTLVLGVTSLASAQGLSDEQDPAQPLPPNPSKAVRANKPKPSGFLLRYHFQVNQVVTYEVTHETKIMLTKGEFSTTDRNSSFTRKHFAVISVDENGTAILEPMIDSVKMSAQFGSQPAIEYDSQKNNKPPRGFAGVAKTIGKPLVRLKFSANGELIAAIPLLSRKVQSRVVKNNGPAKPSNDPNKNFLIVFPKKPVQVGESWSDRKLSATLRVMQGRLPLYREYPILRTYKLDSVKGNLATISLTSASLKPISDPKLEAQIIQRLPSGTIVFDLKRGLIVSRTLKTDRKVIGLISAQSRLHVISNRVEKMIPNKLASKNESTAN